MIQNLGGSGHVPSLKNLLVGARAVLPGDQGVRVCHDTQSWILASGLLKHFMANIIHYDPISTKTRQLCLHLACGIMALLKHTEAGFMRTARRETHFLYPDRFGNVTFVPRKTAVAPTRSVSCLKLLVPKNSSAEFL